MPFRFAYSFGALLLSVLSMGASAVPTHAQQQATFAQVQDTVSNPIRMACGERVDPVGFVLFLHGELDLTERQVEQLRALDESTRERNRPLAAAWRTDRSKLAELRASYRSALAEIETILTSEQVAAAMQPLDRTSGPGSVRCVFRSHLAIVR